MNILVCMKGVPSTGQVQVDGQFKLKRDGTKLEWNISDQAALECALHLKGAQDTVTVLSMGPGKLRESMRELLARGVDRCILITDPAFAGSDTYATARILSAAIEHTCAFDLLLCGRRAVDGETGQVPGMLSASLGIPCLTNVEKLSVSEQKIHADRRLESGIQYISLPCPALVSICEYTYTLRLPSIMGMRRAKNMTIETVTGKELGLTPDECGLKGSLTKVLSMDNKFPGLRKGPKVTDIHTGVAAITTFIKEVE